jgi:uncharacterized protein YbcV (DUF1398 family)
MDQSVTNVMLECSRASEEGRITFPQVVGALMAAGVERYHADLAQGETVYYMPSGESFRAANGALADTVPGEDFSGAGIEAALRAVQSGSIKYRDFCARIAAAGCVGYMVSLKGRRAVYYGRTGESFVEPFPQARN